MSRYCRICRNTACANHGKDITLLGEGYQCNYIPVPTNADRIRAMSDEELAGILFNHQICYIRAKRLEACSEYGCKDCILDWLIQPAEVDHE